LITENISNALEFAISRFREGRQVVLKPVSRGEGVGVQLLQPMDSETTLRYLLWYSSEYGDRVFYLQDFVDNLGYDVRLFVIGGRVVARMKRSKAESFLFNMSRGGAGEVFNETRYDELALKSVQALDAKVAGVDVMPTRDGAVVLEVNLYPGFKGITEVTGVPVAKLLADYFESFD